MQKHDWYIVLFPYPHFCAIELHVTCIKLKTLSELFLQLFLYEPIQFLKNLRDKIRASLVCICSVCYISYHLVLFT